MIYTPQEGVTPNKKVKKLYRSITEEIIKANEEDQHSIIIGNFNAKIGDKIKGNITAWKVSKNGVFYSYFPVFGLNKGKYRPEKTPYLDTFQTVHVNSNKRRKTVN